MINISTVGNSIVFDIDETNQLVIPKGKASAQAESGENQSVNIRLLGSRKNILSFRFDKCNLASTDAEKTAEAIGALL